MSQTGDALGKLGAGGDCGGSGLWQGPWGHLLVVS